jgi:hypothetical protein
MAPFDTPIAKSPLSSIEGSHLTGCLVLQVFLRPESSVEKEDEKEGQEALTDSIIETKLYAGNVENMDALFVELRMFQKYRDDYLDDDLFRSFQLELLKNPEAGDLIEGTGGLRKIRFNDQRRGKGKRSGLRVIYYWWSGFDQFWLFTVYSKDEQDDLSPAQKKLFRQALESEINTRIHYET